MLEVEGDEVALEELLDCGALLALESVVEVLLLEVLDWLDWSSAIKLL